MCLEIMAVTCPLAVYVQCKVMHAFLQGHLDMVAHMAVLGMAALVTVAQVMAAEHMVVLAMAAAACMGQAHMAAAVCMVAIQCMAGQWAVPCMAAVMVEATAVVMVASMGQVL